jgi:hypothetical protein
MHNITSTTINQSNSLTDLAARIRAEHEATATALKDSVMHAMAAGDLLIEAKAQVPHGSWLPWLRDHCTISERTAQLYMRVAKNRTTIEAQIRSGDADLSLNEVTALLMLSSDVRKLLAFARDAADLSGQELVDRCIAEGIGVIQTSDYNPFAGRTEEEVLEWHLFTKFLSYDGDAGRGGFAPQNAWYHVEYLLQRPFQNVAEWLGPEGDRFRKMNGYTQASMPEQFMAAWAAFLAEHRGRTLDEVSSDLKTLQQRFEQDRNEGRSHPVRPKRRARRLRAA